MNAPPRISVLVTAHNAADTIRNTLRSVEASAAQALEPVEVVLVDDRSTDGTADIASSSGLENLRIITIDNYEPGSLTARQIALQRGFEAVRGEFLFLTDADASVSDDWIREGVDALNTSEADAVAAPVSFTPRGGFRADLQTVDSLYYMQVCSLLNGLGRRAGFLFGDLAVRRNAVERVGGLSGRRFSLTEDLAFARSLKRIGARILFRSRPGVEVAACRSWGELVERANRTSRGGFSSLALVLGVWMGILLGLAVGSAVLPSLLGPWLLLRYGLGVAVTALAVARAGTWRLLPYALLYEVSAIIIGLVVFARGLGKPDVHWGDVVYEHDRS
jgi:cellulose synthase/poly-beta-1,6-N-acetylglucosamine synthase-like glycosyltransferase